MLMWPKLPPHVQFTLNLQTLLEKLSGLIFPKAVNPSL